MTNVTFVMNEFKDAIEMFKDENKRNEMIDFLEKFKVYNPEIVENNTQFEVNGVAELN